VVILGSVKYIMGGIKLAENKSINCTTIVEHNGVKLVKFNVLEQYDNSLKHFFTTRLGGVSTGECYSLNMGFNRNDSSENVNENFRRVCKAEGIDYSSLVLSNQVHDNRIWSAKEDDKGKGITRKSDIIGIDGFVTNCRELPLVTFYADCVPVFLFDPVRRVIGLAHSGWKGTFKKIAAKTVKSMKSGYDCASTDIIACIGPSIGKCCFEVGKDVYEEFISVFGENNDLCSYAGGGKWFIDLKNTICSTLTEAGINDCNVHVSSFCTKCEAELFFSHRRDKGRTGSMAAFMQLI
jgi:YfiH family protein